MAKKLMLLTLLGFTELAAGQVMALDDGDWMVWGDNMYAQPPGNVGIGTAEPDRKLHVIGDVIVEAALQRKIIPLAAKADVLPTPAWLTVSAMPGADAGLHLTAASAVDGPWLGTTGWNIYREAESADLYLQNTLNYFPGYLNAMVIQSNTGNIGMGTETPGHRLDVVSGGEGRHTVASFRNPEDLHGTADIIMGVGGGGPTPLFWNWALSAGNGTFSIGSVNVFPPTLNLSSSGYLGVGVQPPQYGLHLPDTKFNDGAGMANHWLTYSSKRWKNNIRTIDRPLEKVKQLRGVYYHWKQHEQRDLGLIAEEVSEVVPEVVQFEANGEEANGVAYDRLVALLIEAVKEQDRKIEALETKLAQQQQLVARLEALEKAIAFQGRGIGDGFH